MKKLFMCILAFCLLLSVAACGTDDKTDPTAAPTTVPTSAPTDPAPTDPVNPPDDPVEPEPELELSDDWKDFTVRLGDQVYQFPCVCQDFADNGLKLSLDTFGDADLEDKIEGHSVVVNSPCVAIDNQNHVSLNLKNNLSTPVAVKNCAIESIEFAFHLSGAAGGMETVEPDMLTLAGGITGASTIDEIKSAWGEPAEVNTYETGTAYTYKTEANGAEMSVSIGFYSISYAGETGEYMIISFRQELPLV